MFKLFTFLFHTFPLILAWLYLLVAIFCVVVHIKQIKSKAKVSIGQYSEVEYENLNGRIALLFLAPSCERVSNSANKLESIIAMVVIGCR